MRFFVLIKKDLRNAFQSFGPALMLGVPLLLIIEFLQDSDPAHRISPVSALWLSVFIASTALFYRSFGFENRNSNFQIYTAFQVPRLQIFISQSFVNAISFILINFAYLLLSSLFWSPLPGSLIHIALLCVIIPLCLSPLGSFLGLLLQTEREFLFSVVYLPLATPVILAAHSLSQGDANPSWLSVLIAFGLISALVSAFLFQFFFDEFSQTS